MSRLLQGERCGDGPSVRKADLGDAGGFLGSDERGGFARRQGRTRDADSQRGVGRVNTGAPRSVGEWAGSAMIALWGGKRRGLEKRPWQGGLSPSARNLPTPATVCHQLPGTASLERGFHGIGAWAVDAVLPSSGGGCLDRRLGYEDRVSGRSSTAAGPAGLEKQAGTSWGPVTVCHIAVRRCNDGGEHPSGEGERAGRGDQRSIRWRGRRSTPNEGRRRVSKRRPGGLQNVKVKMQK